MKVNKTSILTSSNQLFDLCKPDEYDYSIDEIYQSLSNICRFTGHSKNFFSVAAHSALVVSLLPRELHLEGLLHDAAEAYIGDVSTPLKNLLPEYKAIEKNVEAAIIEHFGIKDPYNPLIKKADITAYCIETKILFGIDPVWIDQDNMLVIDHELDKIKTLPTTDDFERYAIQLGFELK